MTSLEMKDMLLYVAKRVIESKDYLTEVDSMIGDGDHGIGMENGFKAAEKALAELPEDTGLRMQFMSVGRSMLMTMGGASGALFGTLFSSIGKGSPEGTECTPADLAKMFRGGLDGVKMRGKAEVGDKTMVDSLEPAVIAMEENCGEGFEKMLESASEAAWKGVEATKDMMAKFGRSKTLMERSIGHQDAGATSIAIIVRSMAEYVKEHGIA